VNSANKHGILLEVVQELTDLDLNISKAYIASDGGWFMDGENVFVFVFILFCNYMFLSHQPSSNFMFGIKILLVGFCMFITFVAVAVYSDIFCPLGAVFHVTDQQGNKIREADVLEHIQKVNFF
jgi:hypothetical protein